MNLPNPARLVTMVFTLGFLTGFALGAVVTVLLVSMR